MSALLAQNLKRGNSTLLERLREEAEKSGQERLQESKKMGEEAGTKLLGPMGGQVRIPRPLPKSLHAAHHTVPVCEVIFWNRLLIICIIWPLKIMTSPTSTTIIRMISTVPMPSSSLMNSLIPFN